MDILTDFKICISVPLDCRIRPIITLISVVNQAGMLGVDGCDRIALQRKIALFNYHKNKIILFYFILTFATL